MLFFDQIVESCTKNDAWLTNNIRRKVSQTLRVTIFRTAQANYKLIHTYPSKENWMLPSANVSKLFEVTVRLAISLQTSLPIEFRFFG